MKFSFVGFGNTVRINSLKRMDSGIGFSLSRNHVLVPFNSRADLLSGHAIPVYDYFYPLT